MDRIEFTTLYDKKIMIHRDKIEFRPAAYGIVIHDGKILLTNTKSTGKFSIPGGAIELGETTEQGLKRELLEETGIEVDIKQFATFVENNFYYDPSDTAWQVFAFIFLCSPKSFVLTDRNNVPDDESEKPQWVPISTLTEDSFQAFGKTIMEILGNLNRVPLVS